MAYELFISYSTKDIAVVDHLKAILNSPSINLFVAEYSVQPSESLNQKIYPAIQNSDLFLLLWSKNSQESPWVAKEIEQAKAFNKTIFPVLLDEEAKIPAVLGDLKYLPAHTDPAQAMQFIQKHVFEKAQKKQNEALLWLTIGGALLWLASK